MRFFIWSISVCWLFSEPLSLVQAQVPTREQFVGTWIGVRREFDEQASRPYPLCLKLNPDGSSILSLIDENPPVKKSTWSMTIDKVRLDTNTFALNQWVLRGDELRLTAAYPTVFRRLTSVAIDSASVRQFLTDYQWQTDSLTYHFHRGGVSCLSSAKAGTVAVRCWRLAQIDQSVFLVIKGSADSCSGDFDYVQQITRISSDQLECLGGKQGTDRLLFRRGARLDNNQRCEPMGFQPCNPAVVPYGHLYPYFTYRTGRLGDIRQVVDREYKPVASPGQSGLIRFRFMVNCQGKAGQFEVLEVDENYRKCAFDPRITSQLRTICQTKLTDWEPGKENDTQTPVDTYCLLTFRLKDGLITEIFP